MHSWHSLFERARQEHLKEKQTEKVTPKVTPQQAALVETFIQRYPATFSEIEKTIKISSTSLRKCSHGNAAQSTYFAIIEKIAHALAFEPTEEGFKTFIADLPATAMTRKERGNILRTEKQLKEPATSEQRQALKDYLAYCDAFQGGMGVGNLCIGFGESRRYLEYIATSSSLERYQRALSLLGFEDEAALRARTEEMRNNPAAQAAEQLRLRSQIAAYRARQRGLG